MTLLEIGPGQGALTHWWMEQWNEFICLVEKDDNLAKNWVSSDKVSMIQGDFLRIDPLQWQTFPPIAVVSNLPYSASIPILKKLVQAIQWIPVMILMFQAEVAERLSATVGSGTRVQGGITLWIQNLWDVKKFLFVYPEAFFPRPQVNSEVLIFKRREMPCIPQTQHHPYLWKKLLEASFSCKRKMLRTFFPWPAVLEAAKVEGTKRAEVLNWEEWTALFIAFIQAQQKTFKA